MDCQLVPQVGMVNWSWSRGLFIFWEIIDDISEIVQERDIVAMED